MKQTTGWWTLGCWLALHGVLPAQGEPGVGWWAISTDLRRHVFYEPGPRLQTVLSLYSHTSWAFADGTGLLYTISSYLIWGPVITPVYGIFVVRTIPSTTTWQPEQLVVPMTVGNIEMLVVDRKRFWTLGIDGNLKYVPRSTVTQPPTTVANLANLGIVAPPPTRPVLQFTTGREVIVSIASTGAEPAHVYAIDVEANPVRVRPLARWTTNYVPARTVRPGRNGKFLVVDHPVTYELDPVAGTLTALPLSPPPYFYPPSGDQPIFDYDPWEDRISIGLANQYMRVYSNLLHNGPGWWLIADGFSFEGLSFITSLAPKPFELIGIGCANNTGRDPRMGWQGLPRPGQSFSLMLRDAEPSGFGFLWLGLSDTYWAPFGSLPFDAAPLGAPGCLLRVSADVPFPLLVDPSGRASFAQALPPNPLLLGLEVFAQTASSSTANAFGFATSDALVIRVR